MPSIGGNNFIRLRGEHQPMGDRPEVFERAGADGVSLRRRGKRPEPFVMESVVDATNAAGAETLVDTYKALEGTLVTLVDDLAQTTSSVAVLAVQVVRRKRVETMVGGLNVTAGNAGYLVTARWTLLETVIP